MVPNVLREYFVLNLINDNLSLTRMGSFSDPGQAIRCAAAHYADGFYTILTAREVGCLRGVYDVCAIIDPNFTGTVAVIWKYLMKGKPMGYASVDMKTLWAATRGLEQKPAPMEIENVEDQQSIYLTLNQVQNLLKTIGVSMT